MTISRLDLDGLGSPAAIAKRILELETDLPLVIPLEDLCMRLDISSIEKVDTQAFEAALVMDVNKGPEQSYSHVIVRRSECATRSLTSLDTG